MLEINNIYDFDAYRGLKLLDSNSVDCCVTSPPYYGLRDYNASGQIGLEDTPEAYIARLIAVFDEVYRVLKPSGTFWLNIGDSYAGSGRGKGDINRKGLQQKASFIGDKFDKPYKLEGYKNKDLIGVPWMLAFALRDRGWYLRQDIIWHKPNPMPESVKDRCTKSHEYIFLLTKSATYYFDNEAILEPAAYDGRKDTAFKGSNKYAEETTGLNVQSFASKGHERRPNKIRGFAEKEGKTGLSPSQHGSSIPTYPARNKRDVWSVCAKAEKESHFAVFPDTLIVDCIKAGCPEDGIVIDPFMGSGTTAVVARKLSRNYIGFELNPEYVKIAERKIRNQLGMFK
jgi:DNA modification methylase